MRVLITASLLLAGLGAAAQALSGTFVVSNYGGFNIACKGGNNGSINLTPSGGTPPYTYEWSNNATTQDLSGLTAGYYKVKIRDAANNAVDVQTTLTEPTALTAFATLYEYGNGYNVSLFNAYNGSITVTRTGGKTPYTQLWSDGNTQQSRTGVGADNYSFTITDANGCVFTSPTYQLTQPDRSDWTMGGNAGTNPATQYIGTSDNKDVVFKTNGSEALRLMANGDIRTAGLSSATSYKLVMADSLGTLKAFDQVVADERKWMCPDGSAFPWTRCGNNIGWDQVLGTLNDEALRFVTHGLGRMQIDADGKVGIGIVPPANSSTLYQLYVEGGIVCRDVKVTINAFQDYVFDPRYELMPMDKLREYININGHLPTMPKGADVEAAGGMEIGDLQMRLLRTVEEQMLYILQLQEELAAMKSRVAALETSGR